MNKLAHHRQKVIQRKQQRFPELHGNGFLCRVQRRLQAMRGMRAVPDGIPAFPLANCHLRGTKATSQGPYRLVTLGDLRPYRRGRAGPSMQS